MKIEPKPIYKCFVMYAIAPILESTINKNTGDGWFLDSWNVCGDKVVMFFAKYEEPDGLEEMLADRVSENTGIPV